MAARLTAYVVCAIVAGTFIAGLIVGAQRDDNTGPVDLIVYNGRVYPANGSGFAEAVAVRGNQILRVGSNREIKRLRRAQTIVVDAHGGAVLPGFNDAHADLIGTGLDARQVDLREAIDAEDLQARVREFAVAHPDEAWILGGGWSDAAFLTETPARELLDAAVPDRPVYLLSAQGRTAWANSKALSLAGLPSRTRGRKTLTGVLDDRARTRVNKIVPRPTETDRKRALLDAIAQAHRVGVTSVHHVARGDSDVALLDEARRSGDLALRVYAALALPLGTADADLDRADLVRRAHPDDPLLKAGAAALSPLSVDAPGVAETAGPLTRLVTALDARGWQIMIDAVSADTVRLALDAYEQAARLNQAPARGRRHRIERIETIDAPDMPRFARLGVIASLSPFRGAPADATPSTADALHAAGAALVLGSRWPAARFDPRVALFAATTAPAAEATEGAPPLDAPLALGAAVDAFTRGGAYASFDEHRKGSLARGMLADIVILSTDIFAHPPERLLDAEVEMTIFDGKVVYARVAPGTSTRVQHLHGDPNDPLRRKGNGGGIPHRAAEHHRGG